MTSGDPYGHFYTENSSSLSLILWGSNQLTKMWCQNKVLTEWNNMKSIGDFIQKLWSLLLAAKLLRSICSWVPMSRLVCTNLSNFAANKSDHNSEIEFPIDFKCDWIYEKESSTHI